MIIILTGTENNNGDVWRTFLAVTNVFFQNLDSLSDIWKYNLKRVVRLQQQVDKSVQRK